MSSDPKRRLDSIRENGARDQRMWIEIELSTSNYIMLWESSSIMLQGRKESAPGYPGITIDNAYLVAKLTIGSQRHRKVEIGPK
jgi:hypothetical protein